MGKRKGDGSGPGDPCGKMMPLALMMLPLVMWQHRRELRDEWRRGKR